MNMFGHDFVRCLVITRVGPSAGYMSWEVTKTLCGRDTGVRDGKTVPSGFFFNPLVDGTMLAHFRNSDTTDISVGVAQAFRQEDS